MVSIIWHRLKIYAAGSAEDVYIQIIVQSTWEALPAVIHILIGIIPSLSSLCSFYPLSKLRGRNFL